MWAIENGTIAIVFDKKFGATATSILDAAGHQYVNVYDRGREYQSAFQLDDLGEGENPTEGGSLTDSIGPTTTSVVISAGVTGNVFESCVQAAYWQPYLGQALSPDTICKRVTVGLPGLPNAMKWETTLNVVGDHSTAYVEGLTGYGPLMPGTYLQKPNGSFAPTVEITPGPTPDTWNIYLTPIIKTSADGSQAVGVYSPDKGRVYLDFQNMQGAGVNKWDCSWGAVTPFPAGAYHYTCYVAFGTLEAVSAALAQLNPTP